MPCSITGGITLHLCLNFPSSETGTEVEEASAEDMEETMEGDMVEATEEGISTGE